MFNIVKLLVKENKSSIWQENGQLRFYHNKHRKFVYSGADKDKYNFYEYCINHKLHMFIAANVHHLHYLDRKIPLHDVFLDRYTGFFDYKKIHANIYNIITIRITYP